MRWATRARCHVDRTAWAWLIRRFIDPDPRSLSEQADQLSDGRRARAGERLP